jgi:thiamine biosynthesis protein ThiI
MGNTVKAAVLFSGGIDSSVALGLALEKGVKVEAIHFSNYPFVDADNLKKITNVLQLIANHYHKDVKMNVVPHGETLLTIKERCNQHASCVACRAIMYKTAEKLAERLGADMLITGENLGQVASQTLHNLVAESRLLRIVIVRPLLLVNKEETIKIAEEMGILQACHEASCCCMGAPHKPVTQATTQLILRELKKIGAEKRIGHALANVQEVMIRGNS